MQESLERIQTFDSAELLVRVFAEPAETRESRSPILILHGYSDHGGRYLAVAQLLVKEGFAVVLPDLRGCGQSGPGFGYCQSIHHIVFDIIRLINWTEEKFKCRVGGIVAHSFGAMAMTYAAALLGANCPPIFMSSPCFNLKKRIPGWQITLLKAINALLPKLMIPSGVIAAHRSNNPENNRQQYTDPLIFNKVTLCFGLIVIDRVSDISFTRSLVRRLKVPVTVYSGAEDKICSFETNQSICAESPQIRFHGVARAGHELFLENNGSEQFALEGLRAWLLELTQRAETPKPSNFGPTRSDAI
jgi:alpha-beta hydrolase superfamily lysophospholipase